MYQYCLKILVVLVTLLCGACKTVKHPLEFVAKLPQVLEENSGIVTLDKGYPWFINDSGNLPRIYQVNYKGAIVNDIQVKATANIDWEELTKDDKKNIYIGDFGNNANKRKDLSVYKIPNPIKNKNLTPEKISFYYPEQKKFPPKKKKMFYDAEAMFYKNDSLFIITKNQSKGSDGTALLYKVPAKKGSYKAVLVAKFIPCVCKVTAAAISPDKKTVALLTYGKLILYSNFKGSDFTTGTKKVIDLKTTTQLESLCFRTNDMLLISDEESGLSGRNLYRYRLR